MARRSSPATTTDNALERASNLVVLTGAISSEPERRELAAGVSWQFDLATTIAASSGGSRDQATRRCTVPVNWFDPSPAEVDALAEGVEVLVVGTVQRRFFRSGGTTQSRTEVVPDRVVPVRRRATVRSALAAAAARLT